MRPVSILPFVLKPMAFAAIVGLLAVRWVDALDATTIAVALLYAIWMVDL